MEMRNEHFLIFKESTMTNPIQTVAFTVPLTSPLRTLSLVQLAFPDEWFEPLLSLQAERNDRLDQPNTIAVGSLNAILHALVPYLLAAPNGAKRRAEINSEGEPDRPSRERPPWLLAERAIPIRQLWTIVQAWLELTYSDCDSFAMVKDLLREEDLYWEPITLQLLGKTSENGTADIPSLGYKVLPALLAETLVTKKVSIPIGSDKRPLVRVPVEEGAELMTWPPVYVVRGKKKLQEFGYSYVIKITVQTLVGESEPRIHFHYSVRRWHSEPCFDGKTLYLKRRTSVYLCPSKAWYEPSEQATKAFTIAKIEAVKTDEQGQRVPVWMNLVPEIARRVNVSIPSAEEVTRGPREWSEGNCGIEVGIVYANIRNHPVGVGIGPDLCEVITKELAAALPAELALSPEWEPYAFPAKVTAHPLIKDLRDMTKHDRLAALKQSVGSQIMIEVHWQTEAVRDMLIDRIHALLTLPRPPLVEPPKKEAVFKDVGVMDDDDEEDEDTNEDTDDDEDEDEGISNEDTVSQKPLNRVRAKEPGPKVITEKQIIDLPGGGQLTIVPVPLQFGSPLPLPDKQKKQTVLTHTNERAKAIVGVLPVATIPTLAFIELPNYREDARFARRDPKRAIRLGMARTGRLTQFITQQEKGLQERCASAVRDGLRQLGYLPHPIGFSLPQHLLPEPLLVLGIWFIRITRRRASVGVHLPVVVMMRTEQQQVLAWLPHDGRIRPYRQALLDIANLDPSQVKRKKQQEALNQVRQFLLQDVVRQKVNDVVMFTVAQNARSTWHGLYNSEIPVDALRFERKEQTIEGKDLPVRFRLIRLRTNLRGETPEWYITNSTPRTTAQGLWVQDSTDMKHKRLFYSIAKKPHTAPKNYVGKQSRPGENYRISSIVEVLPHLLQEDDDSSIWAVAVDQWRKMGFLTSDMTLFPIPLEFARKMDEYAEVIGPWIFPEEWMDDDEEDGNDVEEPQEE